MSILPILCFLPYPCRYFISSVVFHSLLWALAQKRRGDRGQCRKCTQMWNFRTRRFWGIRRLCVGWAKKWMQTWPIYWSLLTSNCVLRFSVVRGCWVSNHRHMDNYSSSLLLGHLLYPWLYPTISYKMILQDTCWTHRRRVCSWTHAAGLSQSVHI